MGGECAFHGPGMQFKPSGQLFANIGTSQHCRTRCDSLRKTTQLSPYQQVTIPVFADRREIRFLHHALFGVEMGLRMLQQSFKHVGKLWLACRFHAIYKIDELLEEAGRLEGVAFLAQGTIYPDVIESAGAKSGKAHVIKSHHNVGGLPEYMKLKLVEPLRELFKDEVRKIGVELGLPYEMIYRHPFPGPGLGVRILGEICRECGAVKVIACI